MECKEEIAMQALPEKLHRTLGQQAVFYHLFCPLVFLSLVCTFLIFYCSGKGRKKSEMVADLLAQ